MGVKKRNTFQMNWNTVNPAPFHPNQPLSGVTIGVMTGTDTLYSNIQDVSNTDNQGLEVKWTGDPVGLISILGSESGEDFFALTFQPPLTQPAGTDGGYGIDVNQFPWRYLQVQYENTSGTGELTVWLGSKDLN